MPELDGYELAAMIRQHPRFQQTAIIFVSAVLLTDLDRLRGYECGAVDYVPVPVVPEILRAKVSVFAELYRKTRALERLNRELEQRVAERTAALEADAPPRCSRRPTGARTSSWRCSRTSCAIRWRRSAPPSQLLRLKELTDAQRARARDVIERQVEHLVGLIDDLLDVSRITRGMITLQREPVLVGGHRRARGRDGPAGHRRPPARAHARACRTSSSPSTATRPGSSRWSATSSTTPRSSPTRRPHRLARRPATAGQAVITVTDTGIGIAPRTAADGLRPVHAGARPLGTLAGRTRHRPRAGAPPGRDARRHRDGAQRRPRPRHRVHGPPAGTGDADRAGDRIGRRRRRRRRRSCARRILVADDNDDAAESLALLLETGRPRGPHGPRRRRGAGGRAGVQAGGRAARPRHAEDGRLRRRPGDAAGAVGHARDARRADRLGTAAGSRSGPPTPASTRTWSSR